MCPGGPPLPFQTAGRGEKERGEEEEEKVLHVGSSALALA